MHSSLNSLENTVLEMLLAGDNDRLTLLREQLKRAQVSSRKMTGVGFYTEFAVPPAIPRVPGRPTFRLGDVSGTAANVRNGLGFVLFVSDGALSMLEGYTYDELWPDEVRDLILEYSGGPNRNLQI